MIEVVVIDDHPAILAGIRAWCAAADPPIAVVSAGPHPSAAATGPGRRAPIIVLDLQLTSNEPAYDALRDFVDDGRQVIVYSMRDDTETPVRCLEAGAFIYLTKSEGPDHLVAAIHAAHEHRPYLSPSVAGAMVVDRAPDRPRLAGRETEVLLAWFRSESKQLVADRLGLSPRTVASYLDRIRIKYANTGRPASTKAALVARAIQDGLIHPDEL